MRFVKSRQWLLITFGTFVWSLTMVKSGWVYKYGLGFWGANGHDGIWHLALIEGLSRGGWQMPIFAGETIKNYHLGFDLLLAIVHHISGIPSSILYFQLTPPLLAFLIGYLTFKFVEEWTKSEVSGLWALFFVYFGGSLGWLVGHGESTFWSTQAISTLVNPPFALSLILLMLGLLLLKRQKWIWAGVIFALIPHVKIYGGLLAFAGLIMAGVKERRLFWVFLISAVIYLATNYQLLTNGSSLIAWQPGWYLETMMGLSDRLNWPRFYSAMTTYRLSNDWLKAVPAYLVALAIFLAGNLGTRVVGIWRIGKSSWLELFMWSVIGGGIVIPMLFLQKGTPWNTIQFFYYSLFFLGILAGVALAKIRSRLVLALVVVATIPTTWQTLQHYLPSRPPAMLPVNELKALRVLSQQPRGVVLTYPFDPAAAKAAEAIPPRPLYLYESTAYVSAFSKQPIYLEDEVNLNITGYAWRSRRREASDFFTTHDPQSATEFLRQNRIAYIYLPDVTQLRPQLGEEQLGATTIYGDGRVAVWKVGAEWAVCYNPPHVGSR